jgi:capsular polysaccharide biosynthesis protein
MSQQGLDLRKFVQIVRRHKLVIGVPLALGLLAGGSYAALNPPKLTSQALIVLPAISGGNMATQVVVADSDPVLTVALHHIGPGVTLQTLRSDVAVHSLTNNIITVSASSNNGAQAEAMANAVGNSYLAYISSASSPVGHVEAKMLQSATTASGTTQVKRALIFGLGGLVAGALIGFISALVIGRNDKRLRRRDEIANSIGVPVLASIPVERPADAPAWTKLFEEYEPDVVYAWRLRRALQQLGVVETLADAHESDPITIGVLSLSSDRGALSLGPQIATYAASLGIPTALVIGSSEGPDVIAALRTACAAPLSGSSKRGKYLQTVGYGDDAGDKGLDAKLIVAVAVVDSPAPRMPELLPSTATVLAVSAGAATAEQLARVATIAAEDGRDVTGILVADPDPTDQTTGRIPRLGESGQRSTPTRVQGIPTEIRR